MQMAQLRKFTGSGFERSLISKSMKMKLVCPRVKCPVREDCTHVFRECKLRKKCTRPGENNAGCSNMVAGAVLFVSVKMRLTWIPVWSVAGEVSMS